MVKGKKKFPIAHYGYWCNNEKEIEAAKVLGERRIREQKEMGEIRDKMSLVEEEIRAEVDKKRDYDISMKNYADVQCNDARNKMEELESKIRRLQFAADLCKKSMIAAKKEASDNYRKTHPFDGSKLKSLQNKQVNLLRKLNSYRW